MKASAIPGCLIILCAIPATLPAQQAQEPPPPMVAASYYECTGPGSEVDALIKTVWQPAMEAQTKEGKLIGWGVLRHAWADEWNLVLYRTIADLRALQGSQDGLAQALNARDAEYAGKLARLCPRHKDNIYWFTAGGQTAPVKASGSN